MQVLCPACGLQLAIPEHLAGQAVQCPHCAQVLQLPPAEQLAAAPQAVEENVIVPRLTRPLRPRDPLRGVRAMVFATALVAAVAGAVFYFLRDPPSPPPPKTPEQLAQLKAREFVTEHLKLKEGASFAAGGDVIRKLPGGRYVITSHVNVPSRVAGSVLPQKWTADLAHSGDKWTLERLEVEGQVLYSQGVMNEFNVAKSGDKRKRPKDEPREEPIELPVENAQDKTLPWSMRQLAAEIAESAKQRPTLAVWLLDQSASAKPLVQAATRELDSVLSQLKAEPAEAGKPAPLQMSVAAYAKNVEFLVEEPSTKAEEIKGAFASVDNDDSGRENTFTALLDVAEKYESFRTQGGYVLLILVSDEVGDDETRLEETLARVRQHAMPVYVLGVPAPFGRTVAPQQKQLETKTEGKTQVSLVRQGPESRNVEMIDLSFPDGAMAAADAVEQMSSGFGPFCLTRLCVESGGTYFTCQEFGVTAGLRYNNVGWGGEARTSPVFDAGLAKKYAPEYVSDEEYKQFLAGNKACAALVEAGKLPHIEALGNVQTNFPKKDEASFKRALDAAQRDAAKFEPKIQVLYDTLKRGEPDRAKITQPRWQAAYDLAMGRCLAAKVRGDGYNAMLAKIKAGANFARQGSDTWKLEPADTIAAGSAYEKMIEQARTYLNRVIKEHPGTPWATLAERELQTKLGWEWKES